MVNEVSETAFFEPVSVEQTVKKSTVYNLRSITISSPVESDSAINVHIAEGIKTDYYQYDESDPPVLVLDSSEYEWVGNEEHSLEGVELQAFLDSSIEAFQAWANFAAQVETYCRNQGWIPSKAVG